MYETSTTQRIKHEYTNELELKSLLIRVKKFQDTHSILTPKKQTSTRISSELVGSTKNNRRISKYIAWHVKLSNKKTTRDLTEKKNRIKAKLRECVIELSTKTEIDRKSYEEFGNILLLMIKNILRKPQFSGYTYKDDFYSDAIHKILKYLHNFKYNMISERSGQAVNAFSYISQIIHHSILHIINVKNSEMQKIRNYISTEVNHTGGISLHDFSMTRKSIYNLEESKSSQVHVIESISDSLYNEIVKLQEFIQSFRVQHIPVVLYYPSNYSISFEEYDVIKPLISGVSLIRKQA